MYVCVCIYTYMCMCVYIYIYIYRSNYDQMYTYVCTYIHIHIVSWMACCNIISSSARQVDGAPEGSGGGEGRCRGLASTHAYMCTYTDMLMHMMIILIIIVILLL